MERAGSRRLGFDAEQLAFQYLHQRGLRSVARNFHTRRGEIDLIMLDKACLTFVEVRYRAQNSFADAVLTVDARKQRKLINAASMFLSMHQSYRSHVCRFDIVGVDCDRHGEIFIEWLQDAFRPRM